MLWLFILIPEMARRSHLENARRDKDHFQPDIMAQIFSELAGSVTSL
jgi:hypothetical protein